MKLACPVHILIKESKHSIPVGCTLSTDDALLGPTPETLGQLTSAAKSKLGTSRVAAVTVCRRQLNWCFHNDLVEFSPLIITMADLSQMLEAFVRSHCYVGVGAIPTQDAILLRPQIAQSTVGFIYRNERRAAARRYVDVRKSEECFLQ